MGVCYRVVVTTIDYGSTAQTPWATPLVYPQTVWYAALTVFAIYALVYGGRASFLYFTGQRAAVLEEFHPKSAKEELKDELDDLALRTDAPIGKTPSAPCHSPWCFCSWSC